MVWVATGGAGGAGVTGALVVVVPPPPQPDKLRATNAVTTVAQTALIAKFPPKQINQK